MYDHLPDISPEQPVTPARPADRERDLPAATFRKPSRTIKVEPVRRPAERDRTDAPPAKTGPERHERPSPAPRRSPAPARP